MGQSAWNSFNIRLASALPGKTSQKNGPKQKKPKKRKKKKGFLMTRFKNHLSGPSEPSSKASEPSGKAIMALPRATLVGLMSLLLLGCVAPPVPVPTFIGLTFTDEVSITPNS